MSAASFGRDSSKSTLGELLGAERTRQAPDYRQTEAVPGANETEQQVKSARPTLRSSSILGLACGLNNLITKLGEFRSHCVASLLPVLRRFERQRRNCQDCLEWCPGRHCDSSMSKSKQDIGR